MIGICPRCKERFVANDYDTDYAHACNSNSAALNEYDKPNVTAGNYNHLGLYGKQSGRLANSNEATRSYDRTPRGAVKATHVQRQWVEYIKLSGGGGG